MRSQTSLMVISTIVIFERILVMAQVWMFESLVAGQCARTCIVLSCVNEKVCSKMSFLMKFQTWLSMYSLTSSKSNKMQYKLQPNLYHKNYPQSWIVQMDSTAALRRKTPWIILLQTWFCKTYGEAFVMRWKWNRLVDCSSLLVEAKTILVTLIWSI